VWLKGIPNIFEELEAIRERKWRYETLGEGF
jgi:hypothetical protein